MCPGGEWCLKRRGRCLAVTPAAGTVSAPPDARITAHSPEVQTHKLHAAEAAVWCTELVPEIPAAITPPSKRNRHLDSEVSFLVLQA
jgi:hypothetical protein